MTNAPELLTFSTGHLDFFENLIPMKDVGTFIGHYNKNPNCELMTMVWGNHIIGIAGLIYLRVGVAEVMVIADKCMPEFKKSYYKLTQQLVDHCFKQMNCHRVQAAIRCDKPKMISWIEHLGFVKEGLMKEWEQDHDHYLYARVV